MTQILKLHKKNPLLSQELSPTSSHMSLPIEGHHPYPKPDPPVVQSLFLLFPNSSVLNQLPLRTLYRSSV